MGFASSSKASSFLSQASRMNRNNESLNKSLNKNRNNNSKNSKLGFLMKNNTKTKSLVGGRKRNKKEIIKMINLYKGEHFGDVYMILNKRSLFKLRAKSKNLNVLLLTKYDLLKVSKEFPDIFKKIFKESVYNMIILETIRQNVLDLGLENDALPELNEIIPPPISNQNTDSSFREAEEIEDDYDEDEEDEEEEREEKTNYNNPYDLDLGIKKNSISMNNLVVDNFNHSNTILSTTFAKLEKEKENEDEYNQDYGEYANDELMKINNSNLNNLSKKPDERSNTELIKNPFLDENRLYSTNSNNLHYSTQNISTTRDSNTRRGQFNYLPLQYSLNSIDELDDEHDLKSKISSINILKQVKEKEREESGNDINKKSTFEKETFIYSSKKNSKNSSHNDFLFPKLKNDKVREREREREREKENESFMFNMLNSNNGSLNLNSHNANQNSTNSQHVKASSPNLPNLNNSFTAFLYSKHCKVVHSKFSNNNLEISAKNNSKGIFRLMKKDDSQFNQFNELNKDFESPIKLSHNYSIIKNIKSNSTNKNKYYNNKDEAAENFENGKIRKMKSKLNNNSSYSAFSGQNKEMEEKRKKSQKSMSASFELNPILTKVLKKSTNTEEAENLQSRIKKESTTSQKNLKTDSKLSLSYAGINAYKNKSKINTQGSHKNHNTPLSFTQNTNKSNKTNTQGSYHTHHTHQSFQSPSKKSQNSFVLKSEKNANLLNLLSRKETLIKSYSQSKNSSKKSVNPSKKTSNNLIKSNSKVKSIKRNQERKKSFFFNENQIKKELEMENVNKKLSFIHTMLFDDNASIKDKSYFENVFSSDDNAGDGKSKKIKSENSLNNQKLKIKSKYTNNNSSNIQKDYKNFRTLNLTKRKNEINKSGNLSIKEKQVKSHQSRNLSRKSSNVFKKKMQKMVYNANGKIYDNKSYNSSLNSQYYDFNYVNEFSINKSFEFKETLHEKEIGKEAKIDEDKKTGESYFLIDFNNEKEEEIAKNIKLNKKIKAKSNSKSKSNNKFNTSSTPNRKNNKFKEEKENENFSYITEELIKQIELRASMNLADKFQSSTPKIKNQVFNISNNFHVNIYPQSQTTRNCNINGEKLQYKINYNSKNLKNETDLERKSKSNNLSKVNLNDYTRSSKKYIKTEKTENTENSIFNFSRIEKDDEEKGKETVKTHAKYLNSNSFKTNQLNLLKELNSLKIINNNSLKSNKSLENKKLIKKSTKMNSMKISKIDINPNLNYNSTKIQIKNKNNSSNLSHLSNNIINLNNHSSFNKTNNNSNFNILNKEKISKFKNIEHELNNIHTNNSGQLNQAYYFESPVKLRKSNKFKTSGKEEINQIVDKEREKEKEKERKKLNKNSSKKSLGEEKDKLLLQKKKDNRNSVAGNLNQFVHEINFKNVKKSRDRVMNEITNIVEIDGKKIDNPKSYFANLFSRIIKDSQK